MAHDFGRNALRDRFTHAQSRTRATHRGVDRAADACVGKTRNRRFRVER